MPAADRRTGRRPGNQDTRDTILVAARHAFAAKGFAGATIRSIAEDARVDPALIHHYFGNKQTLFLSALDIRVDPGVVIQQVTAGPPGTIGTRLATLIFGVWESPAGASLLAVVRSAMTEPAMARMVREFLAGQVVARVLRAIDCPPAEADLRGALLESQIAGVLVGRYLLELEPLASQSPESLIADLGATLQRYLVGPLQR